MKKVRIAFWIVFLLLTASPKGISQPAFDLEKFFLYDAPIPAILRDSGSLNTANQDNLIFIPGRTFTYTYSLKKNGKMYYYAVIPDVREKTDPAYNFIDWISIPADSVFSDNKIHPIRSIELYVYKNKTLMTTVPEQTGIKYEFLNGNRRILLGESTTVTENPQRIFLHPPRSHGFVMTEFNPFPTVNFPLNIGNSWTSFISIPDVFLKKANIRSRSTDGLTHFDLEYKITSDTTISTKIGMVLCKKIEAKGKAALGNTSATFYFSEKWGFVEIEYHNIDGSELSLKLTDIKDADAKSN
jgi:hypothetical protein